MTKEEVELTKATYPKFTVYMYYRGEEVFAKTGDWYAERGKCYQECQLALAKSTGFKERQDEDLYNLTRSLENKKSETIDIQEIAERLQSISCDIDILLEEIK